MAVSMALTITKPPPIYTPLKAVVRGTYVPLVVKVNITRVKIGESCAFRAVRLCRWNDIFKRRYDVTAVAMKE